MSKFDEFDLDLKQEKGTTYATPKSCWETLTITATLTAPSVAINCETQINCDTPSFACSGGGNCSSMGRGVARC